jgi:hypothetical protein
MQEVREVLMTLTAQPMPVTGIHTSPYVGTWLGKGARQDAC